MTETLLDVRRSDAAVTALAERRHDVGTDPLLDLLAAWADEADAQPVVEVAVPASTSTAVVRPVLQYGRTVAALTIAITLSSSGIAAAVNGNPLAPLNFVVAKLTPFGHSDESGRADLGINQEMLGLPTEGENAHQQPSREKAADDAVTRGAQRPSARPGPSPTIDASPTAGDSTSASSAARHRQPVDVVEVPGDHRPQAPHPGEDNPAPRPHPRPQGEPAPPAPQPLPPPEKPGTDPLPPPE